MKNRWSAAEAPAGLLDLRVYSSRLLGAEPSLVQWGGGNTSVKLREVDYRGEEIEVLRVKGSGSDLKTIEAKHFSGLRQDDLDRLRGVTTLADEAMVDYLVHALVDPGDPRPSIETLLHGFVPQRWVDHTHADAVVSISNQPDGDATARRALGERVLIVPWVRPGFDLAKAVMAGWRTDPAFEGVVLINHGLITFSDDPAEAYGRTISLVSLAEEFIQDARGGRARFGGVDLPKPARRQVVSAATAIRGSLPFPVVLEYDGSDEMLAFVADTANMAAAGRGPATPDHALRIKGWPAAVEASPDAAEQAVHGATRAAVAKFVEDYEAYVARYASADTPKLDPFPRIVLVPGVGGFAVGRTTREARTARDIYRQTIEVVADANAVGEYRPVAEPALFDIEYWPLELYKLTLAPPPKPLQGRIALVTGGGSGVGRGIARRLAKDGAVVAVADIDAAAARTTVEEIRAGSAETRPALALTMDVTSERSVVEGVEAVAAEYGGLDIVVSNAGIAVVAPIETLELADWERSLAVNATGHFLVAREAVRLLNQQGRGGSLVFISSKNAFAPGPDFGAYSAAKAAETQLAKILAIEQGSRGIRVNIVNPDAIFEGSKLWSSDVRESRAAAHHVAVEELESFYASRNLLGTRLVPEDVAAAVSFLVSDEASKITGCTISVDGGVAAAFPR